MLEEHQLRWRGTVEKQNIIGSTGTVLLPFLFLRRLSSTLKWFELKRLFGMHYSHLRKVSWESLSHFAESKGHIVTALLSTLLLEYVSLYCQAVEDARVSSENLAGL